MLAQLTNRIKKVLNTKELKVQEDQNEYFADIYKLFGTSEVTFNSLKSPALSIMEVADCIWKTDSVNQHISSQSIDGLKTKVRSELTKTLKVLTN
jgi:hypothetical protein